MFQSPESAYAGKIDNFGLWAIGIFYCALNSLSGVYLSLIIIALASDLIEFKYLLQDFVACLPVLIQILLCYPNQLSDPPVLLTSSLTQLLYYNWQPSYLPIQKTFAELQIVKSQFPLSSYLLCTRHCFKFRGYKVNIIRWLTSEDTGINH